MDGKTIIKLLEKQGWKNVRTKGSHHIMKKRGYLNKEFSLVYGAKLKTSKRGYIVNFRDLENVFAEGETRSEAIKAAQEVLDLLLNEMAKDNLDIPDPSPLKKGEYPISVSPKIAVPILLKKIRREQNYSMIDVARSMHVSYQNYQQIESGKNITLNSLKEVSAAIDAIPVVKFYLREPSKPYISKTNKKRQKKSKF